MGDFLKCECPHCGQNIEYPSEGTGQTVPCPTCEKSVMLMPVIPQIRFPTPFITLPDKPPPPPSQSITVAMQEMYLRLTQLTERTIRRKLPKGNTYLHRAVMNRMVRAIPIQLLKDELFMARNEDGETPVHMAARYGHFDQIPTKFLTMETLTVWDNSGKTPLHIAAQRGQAYQIPKEFLTPEFLRLTTRNNSEDTVLHHIAGADMLYLIPDGYVTPEMWDLKNGNGLTPRDCLKRTREFLEAGNKDNPWQKMPATEKQKEKLRFLGCTWDEGITKKQASDALDKCARDFPEVNQDYYNRPATEEQLARLREINGHPDNDPKNPDNDPEDPYYDPDQPLTYREAKDKIQDWELTKRDWERQQIESSDLMDCVDSYWEKHHWDDDYEESERGQFDQACSEILDGWQFAKFGDLPTRKQVAKTWELVKSRKSNKTKFPTHSELIAALLELSPEFKRR